MASMPLRRLPAPVVLGVAAALLVVVVVTAVLGAWGLSLMAVAVLQVVVVVVVLAGALERRADMAELRAVLRRDHARVLTDLARLSRPE